MAARLTDDEVPRLAALRELNILDSAPSDSFDALVRLAAYICEVPIAAVSLIDEHRQWFKAITGLEVTETDRASAFCAHTILQPGILVVPDAQVDPRFVDNPLVVGDPAIRFYAGVPLISDDGYAIGSLCVIDRVPRLLRSEQLDALCLLARQAADQLAATRRLTQMVRLAADQERLIAERLKAEETLQVEREFQRALLESLQEGIVACDANGTLTLFNRAMREFHGLPEQPLPPEQWSDHFSLYNADSTPMSTDEIPLFRAFQGEVVRGTEMVVAPNGGAGRTFIANGQAIYGPNGDKLGAVVAMHDVTDRRRAEHENQRLAAIVESSEDAIIGAGLDGVVTNWNSGAARFYGYSANEIVGRHASILAGSREQGLTTEIVNRLMRGEAIEPIEVVRDRKDGTVVHASLSFSPILDTVGRMAGVSCISRDITARKQAEIALSESNSRLLESAEQLRQRDRVLRAVLESTPIILYAVDAQGIVTLSEGTVLAKLGLKNSEAVGRSVFTFDADAQSEEHTRRAMAGEAISYDVQTSGLCLHTELRPLQDANGSSAGFIGVCFDVTERVASEERFRTLFDQSSHAHLLFDEANGIIDCNAAAVSMMHCATKAQLIGIHPALLSPEFQPDGRRSEEKGAEMCALAWSNGGHRFEWERRTLDGYEYPVEVTLTTITLAGKPVLLAVWHDITVRKKQEQQIRDHAVVLDFQKQELEKTNVELEYANAQLKDLATTDGLTGLKNHRSFYERLADEITRADRYGTPVSVVLLDADYFKQYNDTHGHPAGDTVLRMLAKVLQDCARDSDLVARYGGEEFGLILPQVDLTGAIAFAERVRAAIENQSWPLQPVTASFGVAGLRPGEGCADFVERADAALYRSKILGRNRVTGASELNATAHSETTAVPL